MKKIIKNLKKKIVGASLVMLALQPVLGLAILPAKTLASSGDLFFSEYIEGSSDNKALEIYNGTGAAVNLSTYTVDIYYNGDTTAGDTLTFSAALSVANNDTFVVCHGDASDSIQNECNLAFTSALDFNGDDAIALKKNGVTLDVIGQIGTDPGNEWGTGLTSTEDNTLVRKCSITTGDAVGTDAFNPADEWNGFANNTTSNLGSHTLCPPPEVTVDSLTTKDQTPEITGTVDNPKADIDVSVDGTDYVGTNNQDGTWTAQVTGSLDEGVYDVVATATDDGLEGTDATTDELKIDLTPPELKAAPTPATAGPGVSTVDIAITVNEKLQDDKQFSTNNQQVQVLQACSTCGVTIDFGDGSVHPVYDVVGDDTVADNVYHYAYDIDGFVGKKTVNFTVSGTDLAGNEGTGTGSFEIDNVVLSPVAETPVVTPAVAVTTPPAQMGVQNDQFGGDGASSEQGEVKADTIAQDTGNQGEQKPDEKKEEPKGNKNVPLWGIIFLLILAGIGGYLFYSQNPNQPKKK